MLYNSICPAIFLCASQPAMQMPQCYMGDKDDGVEHLSFKFRLGELGQFSLQKRWLNVYQCIQVSRGRVWSQAFLSGASNRVRYNRKTLMHMKFHPNMGKNSFTVWVTENCNRLPREVIKSPSQEILKNHVDELMFNVLWDDPAWAGGLDQTTHCGPFQPGTFCDSVDELIPPSQKVSCSSAKSCSKQGNFYR